MALAASMASGLAQASADVAAKAFFASSRGLRAGSVKGGSRRQSRVVARAENFKESSTVDVLPSGEWAHNFSILQYEDLSAHLRSKTEQPLASAASLVESAILPDSSHGTVSGEWSNSVSILNYEDLSAYYQAQAGLIEEKAASAILPDSSHGTVSGEWSNNISILSYEDLSAYFQSQLFKEEAKPTSRIADVMSRELRTAKPGSTVGEIRHYFQEVSGLPVVNDSLVCVGVVNKQSVADAADSVLIKDVMISPPVVTMTPDQNILCAAIQMLKNKVHRIPIVNDSKQLVGIVTRTDIFTVLEGSQ